MNALLFDVVRRRSLTFALQGGTPRRNIRHFTSKSGHGSDNEDFWNIEWDTSWITDEQEPPEKDNVSSKREQIQTLMKSIPQRTPQGMTLSSSPPSQIPEQEDESPKSEESNEVARKEGGEGKAVLNVDYRKIKQKLHASMWHHQIDLHMESKLSDSSASSSNTDDIDQILEECSEFFDYTDNASSPSNSNFKAIPDGWESSSTDNSGESWGISQREEEILLQEFERRIAFNKMQISNFIKSHLFRRRRPIDGWKYMIEELGPNAKKSKGNITDSADELRKISDDNRR